MRWLFVVLMTVINFAGQSTFVQHMSIGGIIPNTAVCIVVSYAILRGSVEGAALGFAVGLLNDVFFGTSVGFNALLLLYVGYFCGLPNKDFFKENYLLPFVFCLVSNFAYDFAVYVFEFLLRGRTDFIYYMLNIILPEIVYTSLLCFVFYRILYTINSKIEISENKKRNFLKKKKSG